MADEKQFMFQFSFVTSGSPSQIFQSLMDELVIGLDRRGIALELRQDGRIIQYGGDLGRVVKVQPGESMLVELYPPDWTQGKPSKINFTFESSGPDKTRVTVDQENIPSFLGGNSEEVAEWIVSEILPTFFQALSPDQSGDWVTDRRARRPFGRLARETYQNPTFHWPNFRAILAVLHLTKDDYLLEVGCGGGAFLHEALKTRCRAIAVDHSKDMVRLASETNIESIREKRLEIHEAEADHLPFGDSLFTCAVMTGVFGFLPDPLKPLKEINRTLKKGGRFVMFTGSKELKGTPAAPEPMASHLKFYEDAELVQLALKAGFSRATVTRPDLQDYAKESEIPKEAISLFSGRGGQLLTAEKTW